MPRFYFSRRNIEDTSPALRRLLWRVEGVVLNTALELARRLPRRWSMGLMGWVFALFGPYSSRAAKVAGNLAVAFPRASPERLRALRRGCFRSLGFSMAELASLARIRRQRHHCVEFAVLPGARQPSPNRPVVFVTAHVGAWQLTPLVALRYRLTLPTIYAPEPNPYVDRKLYDLRRAFDSPLVSRDGGIRVLMRALDRGHAIGLTVDTRMRGGDMLPFFGANAATNTAPARLALRYDCDMVPVLAERLPGGRYRINICPAVQPADGHASVRDQMLDMTGQLNMLFERWIQAMPEQWLCMKRRWPKSVYRRVAG